MGKITDICVQKHNRDRVNIFVDGEFVCGMDALSAVASRLRIGDEASEEEIKSAVRAGEVNSAFERAADYLSYAPRCKREIERYLERKGYDHEVVDDAVSRLVSYRYIDDEAYAASYIKSRGKKYGSFRIASELRQKGIAPEIISSLLDDAEESAEGVAHKYMSSHPSADRSKLRRFLAGRGFSWDSIDEALSSIEFPD